MPRKARVEFAGAVYHLLDSESLREQAEVTGGRRFCAMRLLEGMGEKLSKGEGSGWGDSARSQRKCGMRKHCRSEFCRDSRTDPYSDPIRTPSEAEASLLKAVGE